LGEEKEEAKAEEATPTTAASVAFDPRAGEAADPKANPLMHLFNIPTDNMQTLCQLTRS
jgi:hypothetical protein